MLMFSFFQALQRMRAPGSTGHVSNRNSLIHNAPSQPSSNNPSDLEVSHAITSYWTSHKTVKHLIVKAWFITTTQSFISSQSIQASTWLMSHGHEWLYFFYVHLISFGSSEAPRKTHVRIGLICTSYIISPPFMSSFVIANVFFPVLLTCVWCFFRVISFWGWLKTTVTPTAPQDVLQTCLTPTADTVRVILARKGTPITRLTGRYQQVRDRNLYIHYLTVTRITPHSQAVF